MKEMGGIAATGDWKASARERFEALLGDLSETWTAQVREIEVTAQAVSRDRFAENLNGDFRRLRRAEAVSEAMSIAAEICAPFAQRLGVWTFRDGMAQSEQIRGLGAGPVRFRPDDGAAFRAAIESREPVIAIATAGEIGEDLAERAGGETGERVYLFPLVVRGDVQGVVLASGSVVPAPLELVSGILAMRIESFVAAPAPAAPADLVQIGATAQVVSKSHRKPWIELSPEEQAIHLRAQRLARLRVAEIRLEHADAVRRGREAANLYGALREPVDRARDEFRKIFMSDSSSMVDYLYLELVRGLADNDDRLLGPDFPGALL